jgi:hypothetical protein
MKKITACVLLLLAAFVVITLLKKENEGLFPTDAKSVVQMTFEISPYDSLHYTITNRDRIEEIIHEINALDLREPDEKTAGGITYQLRFYTSDGPSVTVGITGDKLIAIESNSNGGSYAADCSPLLALLESAYWDRREGNLTYGTFPETILRKGFFREML